MLLGALGLEFDTVPPQVDERRDGEARELVESNAVAKAQDVAARVERGATVLAGDTEVALEGEVLGQPGDGAEAESFIRKLSGREHEVLGGLAVSGPSGERSGVAASKVRFRELEPALIAAYVASGEWRGRAGGYAVQGLGSALVDAIEGDLSNVIGLPVGLLSELAPELLA